MASIRNFPYKRFEGMKIPAKDLVIVSEDNGRTFPYSLNDIQDLLEDFRAGIGILQPIIVTALDKDKVKVAAGYRRAYAAQEFSKESPEFLVPCVLVDSADDTKTLELNIKENTNRIDPSFIDRANNADRLLAAGKSTEEVAGILRCSPAQVGQYMKVVRELEPRLQFLVHTRVMTADAALNLIKEFAPEDRGAVIDKILEDQANKILDDEVAAAVDQERPELSEAPGTGDNLPPKRKKESTKLDSVPQEEPGAPKKGSVTANAVRRAKEDVGGEVSSSRKMPELKRYLQEAIDEEGPGSNQGEVAVKKALLEWLSGKLGTKALDNRFGNNCKVKGA